MPHLPPQGHALIDNFTKGTIIRTHEEYKLLLSFELETTPVLLSVEAEQDKASETGQKKKMIITVIPDTSCFLSLDCP